MRCVVRLQLDQLNLLDFVLSHKEASVLREGFWAYLSWLSKACLIMNPHPGEAPPPLTRHHQPPTPPSVLLEGGEWYPKLTNTSTDADADSVCSCGDCDGSRAAASPEGLFTRTVHLAFTPAEHPESRTSL
ncbi:hypothetical protein M0804_009201 [Polistes exclamans]|nr:hypothetical protein M0804_009201 [Polistes exclamans]